VVVVVDVVGVVDGGCASVVSDDMAALTDALGRVTGAVGAGLVCVAVSTVAVAVCVGVPQGLAFVCFAIHCLRSSLIPAA
jgi:hypothetical protein